MWLWRNTALQSSRGKVKYEPKKTQVLQNWLTGLLQEKQFCLLFAKSRAPRQDDGAFEDLSPRTSSCPRRDKWDALAWRGQLMTGIWRIFWLSKQTCLSFVSSATPALLGVEEIADVQQKKTKEQKNEEKMKTLGLWSGVLVWSALPSTSWRSQDFDKPA